MKRRGSLARWVALGGLGLLVAFGVFLYFTHGHWYDGMQPEAKAHFWAEFFVAWGTTALALVTWASVYETQQVIIGEDRRFQQSRAPVVTIADQNTKFFRVSPSGLLTLAFENIGDGGALDVRLNLRASATYSFQRGGQPGESGLAGCGIKCERRHKSHA